MASSGMVIKQGYLYRKRERTSSNVLKKPWQYGYFVLKESPMIQGLLLEEYKDASLKSPKQPVVLAAIKHVGQVNTSKSKQFAFEIVTVGKTALMLACDNEILMNEWMRVFNTFITGRPYLWSDRVSPEGSPGRFKERNYSDISAVSVDSSKIERRDLPSNGTPGNRVFEVKVRKTPLSVANNLSGTYLMHITKSRIFLKTLNGREDVLSWPLNQLRGFKSHPDVQQVFLETGRRCHFGEGRLAFQTTRGEEIVDLIRQAPVPGVATVEERRDSYKMTLQRYSSGSSFDSDSEKRKESTLGEDSGCTVHISGPARRVGSKVVSQVPLSKAASYRLCKQQEVYVDSTVCASTEDIHEDVFDTFANGSTMSGQRMARETWRREKTKSTDSNNSTPPRVISTSTKGSESESCDEFATSRYASDENKDGKPFSIDLEDHWRHKLDKTSGVIESVDQDADSQSYLQLISDEKESCSDKAVTLSADDAEELLSMVVADLTEPIKHKDKRINFKSASTGGIENNEGHDKEQGRRASAPAVSDQRLASPFLEDNVLVGSGFSTPEERFSRHSINKRSMKLEDIKEVVSFDSENTHNEKANHNGNNTRPRSHSDTVDAKKNTPSDTNASRNKGVDSTTVLSDEEIAAEPCQVSSAPVSPFKQVRDVNNSESKMSGHIFGRDPLSNLLLFSNVTKVPGLPKKSFLKGCMSTGFDAGGRERQFGQLPRPLTREPFTVADSPGQLAEVHSLPDLNVSTRRGHDTSVEKAPMIPPKTRSNSNQSNSAPPGVPQRLPLREKSLSKDSSDGSPVQQDGRPYVNSPPPLTPRRPDATPLCPLHSSENVVPPPRPPKPGGLAPLEPSKSLPPFASGIDQSKRVSDNGRALSPLGFDGFTQSYGKMKSSENINDHLLRSPGQRIKWPVVTVTPPRSPHLDRDDKKVH